MLAGVKRALPGLLVAALLTGCSSSPEPDPKPIRGAPKGVAQTVADLEARVRLARYRSICDELFTRAARARAGGGDCEALLRAAMRDVRRPDIRLLSIRVRGNRATARVRSRSAGQRPADESLELVREDGRYLIDALAE
jgi:hypothetical protein